MTRPASATSTLIAEIFVSHPDFVGADVLRTFPGAAITLEYQTIAEPDTNFLFFRVATMNYDELEREMRQDHTISDPTLIATFEEQRLYRVRVQTPLEIVPTQCSALGARVLEVRNDGDKWAIQLHLLSLESLDVFREYCNDHGIEFSIQELDSIDTLSDQYTFGLTQIQQATLLTAHDQGYYDVPRRVSQNDLASELDISKSAVSQRLRRATDLLVENTLGSPGR